MGSKSNVKDMAKRFESSPSQQGRKSKEASENDISIQKLTASAVESLSDTASTPVSASPKPKIRVSSPSETVAALQAKIAFNPAMLKQPMGAAKDRRCGSFSSKTIPLPFLNVSRRSKSESSKFNSAKMTHDTLQRPKVNDTLRRRPRSRSKFSATVSSISSLSSVSSSASISLSAGQGQGSCPVDVEKPITSDSDSSDTVVLKEDSPSVRVPTQDSDASVTLSISQQMDEQAHRCQKEFNVPVHSPEVSVQCNAVSSGRGSPAQPDLPTLQKQEFEKDTSSKTDTSNSNANIFSKTKQFASPSKPNAIAPLQAELFKNPKLVIRLNDDCSPESECVKRVNDTSNLSPVQKQPVDAKGDSKTEQTSLLSMEEKFSESNASSEERLRGRIRSPSNTVAALQAKLCLKPDMLSASSNAAKGFRRSTSSVQAPSPQSGCRRSKSDTNASAATIVHESLQRPVLNRRRRPSQQRFVSSEFSTNTLGDSQKSDSNPTASKRIEQLVAKPSSGSLRIRSGGFSNTMAAFQAKLADTLTKSTSFSRQSSLKSDCCRTQSETISSESAIVHGSLQKPIVHRRRPSQSQCGSVDLSRSLRHRWDSNKKSRQGETERKSNVKPSIVSTLQSKFSFQTSSSTNSVDVPSSECTRKNLFSRSNSDLSGSANASSKSAYKPNLTGRWRRKNTSVSTSPTTVDLALAKKYQRPFPGSKEIGLAENIAAASAASTQKLATDQVSQQSQSDVICQESSSLQSNQVADQCLTAGSNNLAECEFENPSIILNEGKIDESNVDFSQIHVNTQKQGMAPSKGLASKCSSLSQNTKLSEIVAALNAKLGSNSNQLKETSGTKNGQSSKSVVLTKPSPTRSSRRTMSDGHFSAGHKILWQKPSLNSKVRRRPRTQTSFPLLTTSSADGFSIDVEEGGLIKTTPHDIHATGPVQESDPPAHTCPERPGETAKNAAKLDFLEKNNTVQGQQNLLLSSPPSVKVDSGTMEQHSVAEGSVSANVAVALCDSAAKKRSEPQPAASNSETLHLSSA